MSIFTNGLGATIHARPAAHATKWPSSKVENKLEIVASDFFFFVENIFIFISPSPSVSFVYIVTTKSSLALCLFLCSALPLCAFHELLPHQFVESPKKKKFGRHVHRLLPTKCPPPPPQPASTRSDHQKNSIPLQHKHLIYISRAEKLPSLWWLVFSSSSSSYSASCCCCCLCPHSKHWLLRL